MQLDVEYLNKLLVEKKITMFQLAQKLGISYATLQGYCRAKTTIRLSTINKLADFFCVSPQNFLIKKE